MPINGLFSFRQEYQAERSLQALRLALPRRVRVWRDGQLVEREAARMSYWRSPRGRQWQVIEGCHLDRLGDAQLHQLLR